MPKRPDTLDREDAAKWRALCAFLTDNGVDPEKITPDAVADAAIFVFGRFEVAGADASTFEVELPY